MIVRSCRLTLGYLSGICLGVGQHLQVSIPAILWSSKTPVLEYPCLQNLTKIAVPLDFPDSCFGELFSLCGPLCAPLSVVSLHIWVSIPFVASEIHFSPKPCLCQEPCILTLSLSLVITKPVVHWVNPGSIVLFSATGLLPLSQKVETIKFQQVVYV